MIPTLLPLILVPSSDLELPIGYISHYPMLRRDDHLVAGTGVTVIEVRAPWPLIEPKEGQFDFAILDEQLAWAKQHGLQLVFIMEAGPAHAAHVPWLIERLQAHNEIAMDLAGNPHLEPSLFSPTYRDYLGRYLDRTIQYLATHPLSSHVYGYNNGCEWWYPLSRSYSPLAATEFREWLAKHYSSLETLNERWGTAFASWEEVSPPRLVSRGMGEWPQGIIVPAADLVDACYCTTTESHVPVKPGQTLALEAGFSATDMSASAVSVEIAWLGDEHPQPLKIDRVSNPVHGTLHHGRVRMEAVAPGGARRAWLLLKLLGPGKIVFHSVRCLDAQGRQLAKNPQLHPAQGGWQFVQWAAAEPGAVTHGWNRPHEAWIQYAPLFRAPSAAKYPLSPVCDWLAFRGETVAEFLNWMAGKIRAADPHRPVVTYLTFGFANAFEWDYTYEMAIFLDSIAGNSDHQTILGMQLASANGDWDSVTCALDMLRRWGKPLWAIDLLDFTEGVAIGAQQLTCLSLSVLQHGGRGIQYYCWWGTEHYNYSELGVEALHGMVNRIRDQAARMGDAPAVTEIALVMPRMPQYSPLVPPANDWADFMGWYKLLVRAGCCPDVYTLEDLGGADLSHYRAVVVPDCAYISSAALQTLRTADAWGVPVISSGRFALRDMTGRKIPVNQRPPILHTFRRPIGTLILGETYRRKTPTNTPPRLVCHDGSPRVTGPAARDAVRVLRNAGVTLLLQPGTAPVTAVPFDVAGERYAFVLPENGWSGRVAVAGVLRTITPTGWWGPLKEMQDP